MIVKKIAELKIHKKKCLLLFESKIFSNELYIVYWHPWQNYPKTSNNIDFKKILLKY